MNQLKSKETRSKKVKARMSENEYEEFNRRKVSSGLSESELIRRAVLKTEISNNANYQQASVHICQIQTLLNEARFKMDDPLIDEIQEEVSILWQCLS